MRSPAVCHLRLSRPVEQRRPLGSSHFGNRLLFVLVLILVLVLDLGLVSEDENENEDEEEYDPAAG